MEELNNFHRVITGKEAEPLNRTQELIKELAHAHTKVYVEQKAIAEMNFTSSEVPVPEQENLSFDKIFNNGNVIHNETTSDDFTFFIETEKLVTSSSDTMILEKGTGGDAENLKLTVLATAEGYYRTSLKYGTGHNPFWTVGSKAQLPKLIVLRVRGGDTVELWRDSAKETFVAQRRFDNPTRVMNKNITGDFRVLGYNKALSDEEIDEVKRSLLVKGEELEPLKYVELRQMDGTIKKYKLGVG